MIPVSKENFDNINEQAKWSKQLPTKRGWCWVLSYFNIGYTPQEYIMLIYLSGDGIPNGLTYEHSLGRCRFQKYFGKPDPSIIGKKIFRAGR